MRHGQSKANVAGIIVSGIENDRLGDWGLSELGREQVLAAARDCGLPADTLICSSDFSRARQTAEIVRARLGAPPVVVAAALRERCFGDLEGTATGNYARVWAADEAGAGDGGDGGRADGGRGRRRSSRRRRCSTGRPHSSRTWNDATRAATSCWCRTVTRCRSCRRDSSRMDPAAHRRLPHLRHRGDQGAVPWREWRTAGRPARRAAHAARPGSEEGRPGASGEARAALLLTFFTPSLPAGVTKPPGRDEKGLLPYVPRRRMAGGCRWTRLTEVAGAQAKLSKLR